MSHKLLHHHKNNLGPGQSIEQAIAQPVIRMQPVMQQTNVIHVGQGGTVIFPSSQQVNQVRPNQTTNQETKFILIISYLSYDS